MRKAQTNKIATKKITPTKTASKKTPQIDKVDLQTLTDQIISKVQDNFSYRTLISSHPESWLKKDFDIDIPKGKRVCIVANDTEINTKDKNTVYLVIPIPTSYNEEFSDQQLDMIAGGINAINIPNIYPYEKLI